MSTPPLPRRQGARGLAHSLCTDPARGTVGEWGDAQPGSGADTHVAEGSPATVVSPGGAGPRPLPRLVVARVPCHRGGLPVCEQTPYHLGTQAVRWAEVGQAGPSSPGRGWREWGPPEQATWLDPARTPVMGEPPPPRHSLHKRLQPACSARRSTVPGLAPVPGDSPAETHSYSETRVNMPSSPSPLCAWALNHATS